MSPFEHTRELPAPVAAVFHALADPVRLARWWGPDGFTNTFHTFEFTPGGRWDFTMHGPDGTDYPNASVFVDIVPEASVVIRHVAQPHFTLTITLAPTGNGTRVTWVQDFEDPDMAARIRHIVEPANEQNLARWEQEVAAPPS